MLNATQTLSGKVISSISAPVAPTDSPRHARFDRVQFGLLATLLILNLLDGMLTLISVLSGFATEANPLMNELIARGPVSFMIGKLLVVSLSIWLLWRVRRARASMVAAGAACGLYGLILVWHIVGLGSLGG